MLTIKIETSPNIEWTAKWMTNFDDNTMNRLHDYGDRNIECSFIGNVTM